MNVVEFVSKWNDNRLPYLTYDTTEYGTDCASSLSRNLTGKAENKPIRLSSLGGYAVVSALKYYGVHEDTQTYGRKLALFHTGDVVESQLIQVMKACGVRIENTQETLTWYGVEGHCDFTSDGVVYDVKTCRSGNYSRYFARTPYIPLTYVTQVAAYSEALDMPTARLLLYNKDTSETALIEVPEAAKRHALERARTIVDVLRGSSCLRDALDSFDVPPPTPEVFKGEETGMYKPPADMYHPYLKLLYKLEYGTNRYGKATTYVSKVHSTDEILEQVELHNNP